MAGATTFPLTAAQPLKISRILLTYVSCFSNAILSLPKPLFMEMTQITAESVLQHHVEALSNNNLNELMKDYAEHSEVWTPEGEIVGLNAISSFFSYAFTLFPRGKTTLELKKMTAKGNKVFIIWTADSPVVAVPFATDCFEVEEGKIVWQTTAFQMLQK